MSLGYHLRSSCFLVQGNFRFYDRMIRANRQIHYTYGHTVIIIITCIYELQVTSPPPSRSERPRNGIVHYSQQYKASCTDAHLYCNVTRDDFEILTAPGLLHIILYFLTTAAAEHRCTFFSSFINYIYRVVFFIHQ